MKKILTNNIVTPVKQPFTRTTFEYIQSAYTEVADYISNSPAITRKEYFEGNYPQIIFGCSPVTVLSNRYTIPKGAVKFNDVIYSVDAITFKLITPPNVPVCYLVTDYASTDPIILSNGTSANVHQNKKVVIESGVSGGGGIIPNNYEYLCDFYDLLQVPELIFQDDLTPYAVTGQTIQRNVVFSGTNVYSPTTVFDSSINQFDELNYHGIFEVTGGTIPVEGWIKLTEVPPYAMPKNVDVNYYTTCIRYVGIDNVTIQPLLITPFFNMYFYNPSSVEVSKVHIDLRYKV